MTLDQLSLRAFVHLALPLVLSYVVFSKGGSMKLLKYAHYLWYLLIIAAIIALMIAFGITGAFMHWVLQV